jgi:hypothetical protein
MDNHFTKSYVVTLTAYQELMNVQVPLDKDADFFLACIEASYTGLPWGIVIRDSSLDQLSDDYMGSFVFGANAGIAPKYTLYPSIWFPAGSQILLDLQEQSGNPQTFQLIFTGVKRFQGVSNE